MKKSYPTALITGASGFLGSYISSSLNTCGFQVHGLGRRDSCSNNSLKSFLSYNLADGVPEFVRNYDLVVHAAGFAHKPLLSDSDVELCWKVNHTGTANLIRGISSQSIQPRQVVYISTVGVYGVKVGSKVSEKTPCKPSDAYGESKLRAELELQAYCSSNQINLLILRLPLIFGENPPGNLGSMLNSMKRYYYFGIGSGCNKRSIVSAWSVADIIAKSYSSKFGTYNLSTTKDLSIRSIEMSIARMAGRKYVPRIPIGIAKLLGSLGDRLGENFIVNSEKVAKLTQELTFCSKKAHLELGWADNSELRRMQPATNDEKVL